VITARGAIALGLDLGTTRIKGARLDADGGLAVAASAPVPPLGGAGAICEGDAEAYLDAARGVLERLARGLPRGIPLGIASQRSSFTLWDETGRARIPLVSWQDRRAATWCDEHRAHEGEIARRTGLPLSAHYAGPKLAVLQRERPELGAALAAGRLRFGTLDSFAAFRLAGCVPHRTDLTVAARTLMVDLDRGDWSPELLAHYAVPARALPRIEPSAGRALALEAGPVLRASLADQAAAALAVLDDPASALVSLGTGTFVLRTLAGDARPAPRAGYLTGPVLGGTGAVRWALEGTINGSGPALDALGPPAPAPQGRDPAPEAFAIPDRAGLGSPYFRPEIGLVLSPAAERLDGPGRRRAVLEGVLFRVREILEGLFAPAAPGRVLLAGGLALDPAIAPGLADALGRPVEILLEPEAALGAAARLAAGLPPWAAPRSRTVTPGHNPWLDSKYRDWRRWLDGQLGRSPCTAGDGP
jgi:glycerol kinase